MNDMTPTSAERAEKLQGMGCRRKRVEDVRTPDVSAVHDVIDAGQATLCGLKRVAVPPRGGRAGD